LVQTLIPQSYIKHQTCSDWTRLYAHIITPVSDSPGHVGSQDVHLGTVMGSLSHHVCFLLTTQLKAIRLRTQKSKGVEDLHLQHHIFFSLSVGWGVGEVAFC